MGCHFTGGDSEGSACLLWAPAVFCLLLCLHLSLSVSPEPGVSALHCLHAAALQALLGRTHLDLRVTEACLDASSSAPQSPVCAACSFLLLPPAQTDLQTLCLSFVPDFLSGLNFKNVTYAPVMLE